MPDRDRIALLLIETLPLLMRSLGADMRCHGNGLMPAHFRTLGMLSKRSFNLSELAELQSVSMATMSNSVAILVERGLVERKPSPTDRRMLHLSLTPAGHTVMQAVYQSLTARITQQMQDLSGKELEQLETGLKVLQRVLDLAKNSSASCADRMSEAE